MKQAIKVLVAKPGLDGHDVGAKVVTLGLRDQGFEVIYTGLRQTPEMIAQAAVQEDVDVVGLSCLSGAHRSLFPKVVSLLKSKGMEHVLVVGGGNILDEDISYVQGHGVTKVFRSGTSVPEIATYIRKELADKA